MNAKNIRNYFYFCFIIIAIFFFFPHEVKAYELNDNFNARAVFFMNECSYPNGCGTGYNSGLTGEQNIPNQNYDIWLPGYDSTNRLFYAVKQIGIVNTNFNFQGNVHYSFRFDFSARYSVAPYNPSGFVRNYTLWNTEEDNSISCDSNATCSVRWVDNGGSYTAFVEYQSMTAHTGCVIDLGSVNNLHKAVFMNVYPDRYNLTISPSFIYAVIDSTNADIIRNQDENTQNIIDNANNNQQQTNEKLDNIHDDLTNDDISDSEDSAEDLFNNFTVNNHGLSGIITAPLRLLQSLSSSTCSPLTFPLPFVNQNVSLPCMKPIYNTYFHDFLVLYQLITTGLIGYWVVVKIYSHVKGMQNPDDDRIEVFDL